MERAKLKNIKNTNSAFSTTLPWFLIQNIYDKDRSQFAKGLGLLEMERIIYSVLLHDNIIIHGYTQENTKNSALNYIKNPISSMLIDNGILRLIDSDFINESDFVEIAVKKGNYAGLRMEEILDFLGENVTREFAFSRWYELGLKECIEKNEDLSSFSEAASTHIKKMKFINHFGAENNIPFITGNLEEDLFKTDENLTSILISELIERKSDKKEFDKLSIKLKKLKLFRQTSQFDINFPPLMSILVKNSKGKINNFPIELMKLRKSNEFKKLRDLLRELQLEPSTWTEEKFILKFNDILKRKNTGNYQILEKALSIPLSLIPMANETLDFFKAIKDRSFPDLGLNNLKKFNIEKSFTIKPNQLNTNLLVSDFYSRDISQQINNNRKQLNERLKTLYNNG